MPDGAARRGSVFSRFRLAAALLMIAVGVVGALFYGLVNSHYIGQMLGRTLGPYTDHLAQYGFESEDAQLWGAMAARHGVALVFEPPAGEAMAWDETGAPVEPSVLFDRDAPVRGVRTHPTRGRVTFFWTVSSFGMTHLSMLGGLALLIVAVVGAAFWYLHRQLAPLAALQEGVEAVSRGELDARVPVVRDDEIGRVAVAFNDMAGRVGEMIEDRERLLGDVSHELRSPIARMKVALELSPEGDKRDALARDLREMEELIAVLLEREQLRSRTGRIEGEELDLVEVAGEAIASLADRDPGVEVVASGPVVLRSEPALIKLLVQNLVDNAIRFSHPDSRPVVVEITNGAGAIALTVADDGIGVPEGSEEAVLDPFVKLDRARGHHSGYGLGLNLCQRVVELHGGTIALRPNEPRGTRAEVVLPLPPLSSRPE